MSPPNWLLITFDQWRGDWMHQDWLDVPSIRQVASQGWDIRRCYTSSPQCIPARASWITGLRPGQLGVTTNKIFTLRVQQRELYGIQGRCALRLVWFGFVVPSALLNSNRQNG